METRLATARTNGNESSMLTTFRFLNSLDEREYLQYVEEYNNSPFDSKLTNSIRHAIIPDKSDYIEIIDFWTDFSFSKVPELACYFMMLLYTEDKNLLTNLLYYYERKAATLSIALIDDPKAPNIYIETFKNNIYFLTDASLEDKVVNLNPKFCSGISIKTLQKKIAVFINIFIQKSSESYEILYPTIVEMSSYPADFLTGSNTKISGYAKELSSLPTFPIYLFRLGSYDHSLFKKCIDNGYKLWKNFFSVNRSGFQENLTIGFRDISSVKAEMVIFWVCKKWFLESFNDIEVISSIIFNLLDNFQGASAYFKFSKFLTSFFGTLNLLNGKELSIESTEQDPYKLQLHIFKNVLKSSYKWRAELLNIFLIESTPECAVAIARWLSRQLDVQYNPEISFERCLEFLMGCKHKYIWNFYLALFRACNYTPIDPSSRREMIQHIHKAFIQNSNNPVFAKDSIMSILHTNEKIHKEAVCNLFSLYLELNMHSFQLLRTECACDLIKAVEKYNYNPGLQINIIVIIFSRPQYFYKIVNSVLKSDLTLQKRSASLEASDRIYLTSLLDKLISHGLLERLQQMWTEQNEANWLFKFKFASLYSTVSPNYSTVYLNLLDQISILNSNVISVTDIDPLDLKNLIKEELFKLIESLITTADFSIPLIFYKLFSTLNDLDVASVDRIHNVFEKVLSSFTVMLPFLELKNNISTCDMLFKMYKKLCPLVDFLVQLANNYFKANAPSELANGTSFSPEAYFNDFTSIAIQLIPKFATSASFHQTLLSLLEFIAFTRTLLFESHLNKRLLQIQTKLLTSLLQILESFLRYINIESSGGNNCIESVYVKPLSKKNVHIISKLETISNPNFKDSIFQTSIIKKQASNLLAQLEIFSPNSIYMPFLNKLSRHQ